MHRPKTPANDPLRSALWTAIDLIDDELARGQDRRDVNDLWSMRNLVLDALYLAKYVDVQLVIEAR